MDFSQIKNFQVLAQYQHMTYAAEKLHISQPALSLSLNRLEQELGVALFDRVGRTIQLNKCGEIFLNRSEEMLSSLRAAQAELQWAGALPSRTITICWHYKCPADDCLLDYIDQNPETHLDQYFCPSWKIEQELEKGNCDFAIAATGVALQCPSLEKMKIYAPGWPGWYLVLSVDHPRATEEMVHLTDFAEDQFLTFSMETGHRELTERVCKQAGFDCNVVYQAAPGICLDLVFERNWVVMLPPDMVKMVMNNPDYSEKIRFIPIQERVCETNVYLMWKKDHVRSPVAQHFYNYILTLGPRETE